ncbi:MAG: 2-succinyl-5-enolpyruvyl-6-hydroxy-3-cyclohexene-1-carboxylic-acid synthase [Candidatus Kariarchaeaceae archaeon]|jgi:2-succinyl-5-enolpyruvyl-6-hydroxy-3-cyclohexene-1-carboxylate synthase
MRLSSNKNTYWAKIFVDELVQCGLQNVCIAAGSRSTPLTLAFAENKKVKSYSHVDERSAGFFALGLAMSSRKPVALVCTSGTAAANFHPAILEAWYARIPLLILTADRPHHLRSFGANQTMDQIKLYGNHVKWFVDVSPPREDPSEEDIKYLQTLASRVYAESQFLPSGPVHLNFPFSKPLTPSSTNPEEETGNEVNETSRKITQGKLQATKQQINEIFRSIQSSPKGLIVCGPRTPSDEFPKTLQLLSSKFGYPILADGLSGLRFPSLETNLLLTGYDTFLKQMDTVPEPDIIIQFGSLPTSSNLQKFLAGCHGLRITINDQNEWVDPDKNVTHSYQCDPYHLCSQLLKLATNEEININQKWQEYWIDIEKRTWIVLNQLLGQRFFEGSVVASVFETLPDRASIFVSNSLPVRHFDQFVHSHPKNVTVFSNRGLSGIDGTLSTAIGIAADRNQPMVLLTGDLAFYHDMNGLLALQRNNLQLIVILLNNQGGGIFERLPISKLDDQLIYEKFFITPQKLDFSALPRLIGEDILRHSLISNAQDLSSSLQASFESDFSYIFEIQTDAKETQRMIDEIKITDE